jgi:hypothetical protein
MAEHLPAGPAELGAPMDYAEHERTYRGFLTLTKLSILASIDTLIALVLFGYGGFWLGVLMLLMMMAALVIGLVAKGTSKPLVIVTIIGVLFVAVSVG